MRRLVLTREYRDDVTLGSLDVYVDSFDSLTGSEPMVTLKTVELPWKDNQQMISCIPEGEYACIPRQSTKFGRHFHVLDVPGRSWILFHVANFTRDLKGCIAPGMNHTDIDHDRIIDVQSSRKAMNLLLKYCRYGFTLKIKS